MHPGFCAGIHAVRQNAYVFRNDGFFLEFTFTKKSPQTTKSIYAIDFLLHNVVCLFIY